MRKEVIIAVILGAILGLVVAFGVWRANNALRVATVSNPPEILNNQTQTPSPTPSVNSSLSVTRPQNYEVISETPVIITGLTKPNTLVALYADSKDYFDFADQTGTFEIEVDMSGGINNLLISTSEADSQLTLVYTTAVTLDNQSTPLPDSTDPVRQKLQEKLGSVQNRPSSYVGTVTDKTAAGIQMKNGSSEIKQVTIDTATSFVHIDGTSKEVKFSDLAIGDYIAAVGYKDTNNLLTAIRVIISPSPELTKRKIIIGKVTSFTKAQIEVTQGTQKYIVLSNKTVKSYTIDNLDNVKAALFSSIKEGDTVAALGTIEADKLSPRTLFIVKPSQ